MEISILAHARRSTQSKTAPSRSASGRRAHPNPLAGWPVGLVAVVIALLGTALAVPWGSARPELPVPAYDGRSLRSALAADRARARAIAPTLEREVARGVGGPLYEIRAVGEAFRAYGSAEAARDTAGATTARRTLLDLTSSLRGRRDAELLGLRAYQLERFLHELRGWEDRGRQSDDLIELAGPFVELAVRSGWASANRAVDMSDELRAVFFRRRWNELVGRTDGAFLPSLDETRAFYAYLLEHPPDLAVTDDPSKNARAVDEWRLRKVAELAHLDATYPELLAKGVLLLRLGRYPAAAQALADHLAASPDGPYTLRARGYFARAVRANTSSL